MKIVNNCTTETFFEALSNKATFLYQKGIFVKIFPISVSQAEICDLGNVSLPIFFRPEKGVANAIKIPDMAFANFPCFLAVTPVDITLTINPTTAKENK